MVISYGIISDKNICKTLNIFTRENKRFCFFFLLYIWPLLPRRRQRSCIKWCAAFRWYWKVKVEHMQAWRIVHPMSTGRAQVYKMSETCPIFRARTFGLILQVFSKIGKTMKKLYLQYTSAYSQYFDVCIYAGVKTALSTHGLGNI